MESGKEDVSVKTSESVSRQVNLSGQIGSPSPKIPSIESYNVIDSSEPKSAQLDRERPSALANAYALSRARSNSTSSLSSYLSNPIFPLDDLVKSSGEAKSDSEWLRPFHDANTSSKTADADSKRNSPRKPRLPKTSPYFPKSPEKKVKREQVSCVPFPPLDSTAFGLVQERLCHSPFLLLIAVIFLNKTRGAVAMPVFYQLIARYPNPASLASAKHEDVVAFFQHLGLQNQRAKKCIGLAKTWLEYPPTKGKRYRRLHYPCKDDGKDIDPTENPISDDDPRVAWEVGHLVGVGSYAVDSWRIFCRDELRDLDTGLPELADLQDETTRKLELEKEWTRVLPTDKELRAYLRWRWLRLGFEWNPMTGERKLASQKALDDAKRGGVIYEGKEGGEVLGGAVGEEENGEEGRKK